MMYPPGALSRWASGRAHGGGHGTPSSATSPMAPSCIADLPPERLEARAWLWAKPSRAERLTEALGSRLASGRSPPDLHNWPQWRRRFPCAMTSVAYRAFFLVAQPEAMPRPWPGPLRCRAAYQRNEKNTRKTAPLIWMGYTSPVCFGARRQPASQQCRLIFAKRGPLTIRLLSK